LVVPRYFDEKNIEIEKWEKWTGKDKVNGIWASFWVAITRKDKI
jgi:hypothetical protein